MGRRTGLRGRPDEEHEAQHEPRRYEQREREQEAAQHSATVLSPPVSSGVLFTCAGQRVDILTAFKRAGARTIAADVNRLAPALYHADAHAFVPRVDDEQYVPTLRALVHEHDISLVVPLTDLDHAVLSRPKDELGALVLLPTPELLDAPAPLCFSRRRRSPTPSPTSGSRTSSSSSAASARPTRGSPRRCRPTPSSR